MHMRVAGQTRWVAPVDNWMAQIYSDDGSRFSAPITRGEAGLDSDGLPMFAGRVGARARPWRAAASIRD
jgi:hypothetical protein